MDPNVTMLLSRVSAGDVDAGRELLPLLYDELRAIAGKQFRGQSPGHTLQPTVLVHEAFLKLVGKPASGFAGRAHFFAVAATAMRQILVNHARANNAAKRGGEHQTRVALDGNDVAAGARVADELDVLAINEALEQLALIDARKHRIVELRFFSGLAVEEIAQVMDLSKTTIENEWRAARAWLSTVLK